MRGGGERAKPSTETGETEPCFVEGLCCTNRNPRGGALLLGSACRVEIEHIEFRSLSIPNSLVAEPSLLGFRTGTHTPFLAKVEPVSPAALPVFG